MKILFVHNFLHIDYQCDSLYHGLIDNGYEVYETHYPGYMLSSYDDNEKLTNRGFTLHKKLNHIPRIDSHDTIVEKIESNFYDFIIYGCIYTTWMLVNRGCLDYLEIVKKSYSKDKVHFIDGCDEEYSFGNALKLHEYGTVWKTNLTKKNEWEQPISYAIPESQIIKHKPNKQKLFSDIIPGKIETYIYDNEKEYYNDYATSYYGFTWKKAQWNCLRHFEILANRCIPYFPGLEYCPKSIMTNFPKNYILETNEFAKKGEIHPQYNEINEILFEYTKEHLTTKKLANTVLNFTKKDVTYFFAPFLATCCENTSPATPHITIEGNSDHIFSKNIFDALQSVYFNSKYNAKIRLTDWMFIFNDGYSGKLYRAMLNNLINYVKNPKYLEIGIWSGSTIFAAMDKNFVEVTAIANWEAGKHNDIKHWFYANVPGGVTHVNSIDILEVPYTQVDFSKLKKHNVYSYNGPNDEEFPIPLEALENSFILLISNWNFKGRREKVLTKIKNLNIEIIYSVSIRTSNNDDGVPDEYIGHKHNWHNGYFIAVCNKL